MKKLKELKELEYEQEVVIRGWVRFIRKAKDIAFLHLFDGSTVKDIQVVISKEQRSLVARGAYLEIFGSKIKSKGSGQDFEVYTKELKVLSSSQEYPIQKKIGEDKDYLRTIPQYRTKTKKMMAITYLRSFIEMKIQHYYLEKSTMKITPPLITPSDCEGAGEVFSLGEDFFKKSSFLTVSSQLYLESMVRSFSEVYCLAPAFRADPSLSPRHLSEFWMLEYETLTDSLDEVIQEATALIEFIGQSLLAEDSYLDLIDKGLKDRIKEKITSSFQRISYEEALKLLKVESIGSKEEKLLLDHFSCPVILTHFPIEEKPFYMKQREGTTLSFDILLEGVGEIVGGSLREEDSKVLKSRMDKKLRKDLSWYLDIRDKDSIPTGGFGLGFERILMYFLEEESIKDISLFPRWKGHLDI